MKRMISLLMAAALVLSLVPVGALATETGLCEHHSEHTAECGYIEGTPGSPCSHEHDEECYSSVTQCVHTHDESCGGLEDPAACTHVCSADTGCITTALDCKHQHDETCGYVPAAEGTPCTFVCEICSAAANESAQCTCETKCAEGSVNEECPVCGADPSGCTETETVEEPETPQVTTITEWSWVDSLGALNPEDGKLYLPAAVTEASLAGVTDTLPKSITANGQGIPVSWAYDWDTQTFTASLPEGYALAEGADPLTVETVDMGASTLDQKPIGYIDENNQEQTCGEYTLVDSDVTAWSGDTNNGWYVVEGNVTIGQRVTVSGDVKLILTDGCQLTASNGIGINAGGSLTITAQTKEPNAMGSLTATYGDTGAAIGGDGEQFACSIIINGGRITAQRSNSSWRGGAGIGGISQIGSPEPSNGSIIINGGIVTATGSLWDPGIGIGGSNGSSVAITINGGTVNATGGPDGGAGIGTRENSSSGFAITINGGDITANGGSNGGAGIGSGVGAHANSKEGTITITGGNVNATGGNGGAGIGSGSDNRGSNVTAIINGGDITATGGSNGGAGIGGKGATLSGSCGTVIQASSVDADTSGFTGVIQIGTEYRVYGNVVLGENLEIKTGETLTIPAGASLDCNGNLTNDGTILVGSGGELVGTPTGSGTVKIAPTITTVSLPDGTVGTEYSQTLTATGDSSITWSLASGSTLPDGLTLSTDGKISGTPTTAGTFKFTVTATNASGSDSKEYTLTIQSATVPVSGVSLSETALSLFTGESANLTATVQPSNATNQNVTWQSDNANVATVQNGTVTAVTAGEATITVTTEDGDKTATCQVTVKAWDISAAKVTLDNSLTYNGGTQTQTIASVTLNGQALTEGKDYTLTNNTAKDAGTYTLTLTGMGNYSGTLSVPFTIAKAPLTIASVDVQTKSYDGTTTAVVTGVSFSGLVNKENLALGMDYSAVASFSDANAGTGKTVTGKVTLLPSVAGRNYTLTTAGFNATADIAAAPSKLDFKADRTKPIKGQVVTFSVTPQLKGDNRSFLQRLLGIDAPKVEFWVGNTKLGEVKVEEGKTSTFAYDTDKGGLKLGKNTVTAKFTGSGNLQGCEETLVINLQTTSASAPTGDTSNIQLWTAALVVSVLALIGLGVGTVLYRKKRK